MSTQGEEKMGYKWLKWGTNGYWVSFFGMIKKNSGIT